ncbi:uncharacterized protein LOC120353915 [Nilaparvata lugens]|uniref:uncharacterized protein LOC120353915 n=1 Tax=Nilaparvata lugens TaxID=108931 RepID=UPI00193DAEBC|nr:uncharacterized protein LOC120353915 [Nilaparvata lugens]
MSPLNAIVTLVVTYFCLQSFYIIIQKWSTLSFNDKVTALETMNIALVVFFEAFEIIFITRYDRLLGDIMRGKLFGFKENLVNRSAKLAFFRSRKYLRNAENCVYDVNELNEINYGERLIADDWVLKRREGHDRDMTNNYGEVIGGYISDINPTGNNRNLTESHRNVIKYEGRDKNNKFGDKLIFERFSNEKYSPSIGYSVSLNRTDTGHVEGANSTEFDLNTKAERNEPNRIEFTSVNGSEYTRQTKPSEHEGEKFTMSSGEEYLRGKDDINNVNYGNSKHLSHIEDEFSRSVGDNSLQRLKNHVRGFHNFGETSSTPVNHLRFTDFLIYNHKRDKEVLEKRLCIIESLSTRIAEGVIYAAYLIKVLTFCAVCVPVVSIINYYFRDQNVANLQTSFMIYVPFTRSSLHDNIEQFIVVTLVQFAYLYLFFKLMLDLLTMVTLSYGSMRIEIDVLLDRVRDFDDRFCGSESTMVFEERSFRELYELMMKEKLKKIIEHHQMILRRVREFSDFVTYCSVYSNGIIILQLCISIFLIQSSEPSLKFKYSLACVSLVAVVAHYCEDGQMVEDKLGMIRDALYEISWHNLPVSIQKSLLLQLTRNTKPPTIGPLGIFIINRKNLSSIIRASYSYFNVLNHIK